MSRRGGELDNADKSAECVRGQAQSDEFSGFAEADEFAEVKRGNKGGHPAPP